MMNSSLKTAERIWKRMNTKSDCPGPYVQSLRATVYTQVYVRIGS